MSHQTIPNIFDDVSQQMRTNYMGIASFTVLIWDHVDTFTEEVQYIWLGKKGLIGYLFLLVSLSIFLHIYHQFGLQKCNRFIRFEGSMTVIGITVVAIMMLLRISALYYTQKWIIGGVAFLLLFQTTMNAWLLTRGEAVLHNPHSGVLACTMIFDPAISVLASSSAWLPLLYDTVVVGLTLWRTLPSIKDRNASYVMKRLLEDGLIYYTAIFTVTLVLTLMIIIAPPGLKNIVAQLELLMTVAMMSRITLNLKKSVHKAFVDSHIRPEMPSIFTRKSHMEVNENVRIRAPGFNETVRDELDSISPSDLDEGFTRSGGLQEEYRSQNQITSHISLDSFKAARNPDETARSGNLSRSDDGVEKGVMS